VPLSVEMSGVVREYRSGGHSVRALDSITMRIDGGQFVSVVGPSGSGKSTLLHLLGALDKPDSGSIRFNGAEIATMTDDQQSSFRRHEVGFVFQFFNLLPTLSAWENVAIPKLLDGQRLARLRPDAVRLLETVGLGNRIDHRPCEMSGGQMQRVAVARALMMEPRLILADEPSGNLDSATGTAIVELLRSLAHEGDDRSVVMVTHNAEAASAADRLITLQDGALKSDELAPFGIADPAQVGGSPTAAPRASAKVTGGLARATRTGAHRRGSQKDDATDKDRASEGRGRLVLMLLVLTTWSICCLMLAVGWLLLNDAPMTPTDVTGTVTPVQTGAAQLPTP
jgi:putative ABC transport system ATP-binding protein